MSNSKELVSSTWAPGFVERFLPSSQQVSVLFHLSYLCLAKFPDLERILRLQAVETQMLFRNSEAVLLKCEGISYNLVSSLFPILTKAIEKEKPTMAVTYFEKAKSWITEIIQDMEKIVQRYQELNRDVASTTSDINREKQNTDAACQRLAHENQAMTDAIKEFKEQLSSTTAKIEEIKREIEVKNTELQNKLSELISKNKPLRILAAVLPFFGEIIKNAVEKNIYPELTAKIKELQEDLNTLHDLKARERQNEWNLQIQLIVKQMTLSKLESDLGIIPKTTHLQDVQRYLNKIQNILIEVKVFWEKVLNLLSVIKNQTFVDEELISHPEFKDEFVKSISKASECWKKFGGSCNEAVGIFKIQSQDAYNFLEIDPGTLSEEDWQSEFERVKQKLMNLKICGNVATPAIKN